jgi:hypothetical protein
MNRTSLDVVLRVVALLSVSFFAIGCGGPSSTTQPPATELNFLSAPPTQASEGIAYTYTMQTSGPTTNFMLTSSPAGAVLSGDAITWTPTSQQSRTTDQFSVTAIQAGSTATQSWSLTPTGTIRGTTAETCLSDSGQAVTAFLARHEIGNMVSVLVPNATGGFDTHSGFVGSDGTFSIPNVPAGYFWLMTVFTKLFTNGSTIDLGSRYWGGCHPEPDSSAGTTLQISASGLNPWQSSDYFYFLVPNERSGAEPLLTPAPGATSLSLTIPSSVMSRK